MELFGKLYIMQAAILVSVMQAGDLEVVSGIAAAVDQLGVTGVLVSIIVLLLKDRQKQRDSSERIISNLTKENKLTIEKIEERHEKNITYYRSLNRPQ